jgi:hypothetical protein
MNNAKHILEQLGGQDFLNAVGAGCLACYDVGVSFTLPAWASRWGINHVKIAANDIGLYDIAFRQHRRRGLPDSPLGGGHRGVAVASQILPCHGLGA